MHKNVAQFTRMCLILLLLDLAARAQDSSFLNKVTKDLNDQPVQEKVYLHLDKPRYSFGDTIWYKAYTVLGQHHQLSALSGVLYVELISPKDSLVTRQMLPLVSGVSWSDIPLAYTLKQGIYRIRAYTRWMENKGPEYFYDQKIRIGGAAGMKKTVAAEKPDVQFFPEGGELVNGVRSRVAIKAVGNNGLGVDVKGTIEDNTGTVIADFTTQHLGMGEFAFAPEPGKSYRATVQVNGETAFPVELPKAQATGYTLTINDRDKDSVYLRVATNEGTLNRDKGKNFYVIAQNSGKVYYTTQGKLESLAYTAMAAKSRFPMGITQFTLFNQAGEPVAERLAFINNEENGELKLDLNTEKQDQKTKINITAAGQGGKPSQGSFSMAVINDDRIEPNENEEGSILNNILLTSELKGYIEQPNYYFTHISNKTETDLDNLMLTQGYRRYEWKQILTDTANEILVKPERSQEINGVLTTPGGKPIPNGKVTMMGLKDKLIRDTIADVRGRFTFDDLALRDTATLVIRARKMNNGSNVIIKAAPPEYPKIESLSNTDVVEVTDTIKSKQQYEQYAREQKTELFRYGKQLKEVKIVGFKQPKPDLSHSSNLNGAGNADQVIMAKDLPPLVSLAAALNGRARGVYIRFGTGIDGTTYAASAGGGSLSVIVDGNVLPPGELDHLTVDEVYSIEVLNHSHSVSIYGSSISKAGALVITTKMAAGVSDFSQQVSNGITTIKYNGFYKSKAFYVPKYAPKANDPLSKRTTIYWNPNILTDKGGNASLEYFNPEAKGTYRVVIEGIDDDGNLGRAVYKYQIN